MPTEPARAFGLGTLALHAGQQPDPHDRLPRDADPPDHQLRLQEHRTRREPLRLEGDGLDLHAADEPDDRRLRAADGRAGRRHRGPGRLQRTAGDHRRLVEPVPSPAGTSSPRRRSTAARSRSSARPSSGWGSTSPSSTPPIRRTSPRRCNRTRGRCMSSRWPIRRTTCWIIEAIADVSHEHGLPVVCDNTVLDAHLVAAVRLRHRHHGLQRHEVHRRARHEHRRRDRR